MTISMFILHDYFHMSHVSASFRGGKVIITIYFLCLEYFQKVFLETFIIMNRYMNVKI